MTKAERKERRQKAARKAARTRAANKAAQIRWETVDRPAYEMQASLLNDALKRIPTKLHWAGVIRKTLKNGVTTGRLLSVGPLGMSWLVLIDGYKKAQLFHPKFWNLEPINEEEQHGS